MYIFIQSVPPAVGPLFRVDTIFNPPKMPTLHTKPFSLPDSEARLTVLGCPLWTNDTSVQRKRYLFLLPESSPMPRFSAWQDGWMGWVSLLLIDLHAVYQGPNFMWQPWWLPLTARDGLMVDASAAHDPPWDGGLLLLEVAAVWTTASWRQATKLAGHMATPQIKGQRSTLGSSCRLTGKGLGYRDNNPVYYGEGQIVCQRLTRW